MKRVKHPLPQPGDQRAGRERAAAIRQGEDRVTRVTARGEGDVARRMVETARLHEIPVLENFVLSKQLSRIPLGEEIPEALFCTISTVLAHMLELERERALELPADAVQVESALSGHDKV